ncbi:hypothetical protein OTB20_30420 [Streptomyces sp. H27-H1]|uniref:hypothetical protein n=1 Tax=Streptomyces sp. H27-H1 TaxID=2996461 RepID=UPI00226FA499|nr:hypothetical protein [Streptomyces sp. H27-H1]MCY0930430.1 hypothetical protein [Streptomyces sp. H27-H1]
MNKALRRLTTGCATAVSVGAVLLVSAGSAAANTERNGYLETSEFGLYYNSNNGGCVFDLMSSDWNFFNDLFVGPEGCAGRNRVTNDDTASYRNRDTYTWKVGTEANLAGLIGSLPPGYVGNASINFKNKITSATFLD